MPRSLLGGALFVLALGAGVSGQSWQQTTPGKAGTNGLVPQLHGLGIATPESTTNSLRLTDALPSAPAVFVAGVSELAVIFKGGVFGPAPLFLNFGFVTGPSGRITLPFALGADIPTGLELWLQYWIVDPGGFVGSAASNTVKLTVATPMPELPADELPLLFAGGKSVLDFPPVGLSTLDADTDGDLDLVTSNPVSLDQLMVFRGAGNGAFSAPLGFDAEGASVREFRQGDVSGDGVLDLLVNRSGSAFGVIEVRLGAGDGSFGAPETVVSANQSRATALADLDTDGDLDVLVLSLDAGVLAAFLGDGAGQFTEGPTLDLSGDAPLSGLVTGHFDADGALDVAVVAPSSGTVTILIGAGDGGFSVGAAHAVSLEPREILAGDLDRDGVADLVISDRDAGLVAALPGHGDGTFGPARLHPVGVPIAQTLLVDLDGDGVLDVSALADAGHDPFTSVALLRGLGDGDFAGVSYAFAQPDGSAIDAGDFDADGDVDLAIIHLAERELAILLGRGESGFPPVFFSSTEDAPSESAVADLDGDGVLDVVADYDADSGGNLQSLSVALGTGGGELAPSQLIAAGARLEGVALGDVTGDGIIDVVSALPVSFEIGVLPGLGDGSFGPLQRTFSGIGTRRVALGDVNGDGALDAVVALAGSALLVDGFAVLPGDGAGGFGAPQNVQLGVPGDLVRVQDVNGDGTLDVVVGSASAAALRVALGDGAGGFIPLPLLATPAPCDELLLGDWSGDGVVDLATVHGAPGDVVLFEGLGDGTFALSTTLDIGGGHPSAPISAALADVNGDGVDDIVCSRAHVLELAIVLAMGDGLFRAPQPFTAPLAPHPSSHLGAAPRSVTIADMDGNGSPDLVFTLGGEGGLAVFPNQRTN